MPSRPCRTHRGSRTLSHVSICTSHADRTQRLASIGRATTYCTTSKCPKMQPRLFKRDLTSEASYKLNYLRKVSWRHERGHELQGDTSASGWNLRRSSTWDRIACTTLFAPQTRRRAHMTVEICSFLQSCENPSGLASSQQVRTCLNCCARPELPKPFRCCSIDPKEVSAEKTVRGFKGLSNEPARGFYRAQCRSRLEVSVSLGHDIPQSVSFHMGSLWDGASDDEGYTTHAVDSGFVTRFATKDRHKGISSILESTRGTEQSERSEEAQEAGTFVGRQHGEGALRGARQSVRRTSARTQGGVQLGTELRSDRVWQYPCLAVSATTTFEGREAMAIKRNILPERFPGVRIIYGDSVS